MARCDILVVEDDAGIRQTVVECLEFEGYAVRQAASGSEAFAELSRALPSLVFLDMIMPGMSGQEVLAKLRAQPETASLPIVVMTAATPVLSGPVEGASALLAKPFDLHALLDTAARPARSRERPPLACP
jgi:CheY-like chemotaxis protein